MQHTMAVSGSQFAFVLLILESLLDVTVSYQCYYTDHTWGTEITTKESRYCPNGCCGTSPNYYCCAFYDRYYYSYYYYYRNRGLSGEAITGIVLGSLVSVATIIGIIVCMVVMCRNSRMKRRRAASSAGVMYQPSQGVTMVPAVQGQLSPHGVVYNPAPVIQQSIQPNQVQAGPYPTHGQILQYPTHGPVLQYPTKGHVVQYPTHGHVLQYPTYLQGFQQGQTPHAPIAAANQPVQGTRTTVLDQAEKKTNDPPQTYTS